MKPRSNNFYKVLDVVMQLSKGEDIPGEMSMYITSPVDFIKSNKLSKQFTLQDHQSDTNIISIWYLGSIREVDVFAYLCSNWHIRSDKWYFAMLLNGELFDIRVCSDYSWSMTQYNGHQVDKFKKAINELAVERMLIEQA